MKRARSAKSLSVPTPLGPSVTVPSAVTLRKYGLDAQGWLGVLEAQGWVCAICKKIPKTGRLNTDHHHVDRWKKLKPEERRQYVRGIVCWNCNRYYLGRGITEEKAANVRNYLAAFNMRLELRAGPTRHKRNGAESP